MIQISVEISKYYDRFIYPYDDDFIHYDSE